MLVVFIEVHILLVVGIAWIIYTIAMKSTTVKNGKQEGMQGTPAQKMESANMAGNVQDTYVVYCASCGEKLPKNANVCPNCGYQHAQEAALAEQPEEMRKQTRKHQLSPKTRKACARLMAGLIILLGCISPYYWTEVFRSLRIAPDAGICFAILLDILLLLAALLLRRIRAIAARRPVHE